MATDLEGKIFFVSLLIHFERERERERQKGRIPSRLYTASMEPIVGLELMNREIIT